MSNCILFSVISWAHQNGSTTAVLRTNLPMWHFTQKGIATNHISSASWLLIFDNGQERFMMMTWSKRWWLPEENWIVVVWKKNTSKLRRVRWTLFRFWILSCFDGCSSAWTLWRVLLERDRSQFRMHSQKCVWTRSVPCRLESSLPSFYSPSFAVWWLLQPTSFWIFTRIWVIVELCAFKSWDET